VQNIWWTEFKYRFNFTIVVGLIIGVVGEMLNKKIRDLQNDKKRLELENQKLLSAIGDMRVVISQLQ